MSTTDRVMQLSVRWSVRLLTFVFPLAIVPGGADAQEWSLSVGPSFPQGAMGERRAVGGHVALGIGSEHTRRGFQYRVELNYGGFPTRASTTEFIPGEGDGALTVAGGLVYLLYTGAPGPVAFHAGIGAGAYALSIPNHQNPYGLVPGVAGVIGARIGTGRIRGLIELQPQGILSDYGNADAVTSEFVPLRIGVVIQ